MSGATGEPGDWHGAEPVRAMAADYAALRTRVRDVLDWLVHLAGCVGKAGGKPEPGEWMEAWESARALLDEIKERDDGKDVDA